MSQKHARIGYDIPERYRDSFYLANASFFDSSNWFLHRAYEVVFPTLKKNYRTTFQDRDVCDGKIHAKLENVVESLDQCNSLIDVRFPVRRENGDYEVIRGFRAHYGETVRQTPCLGGLRIDEHITRDHMKALSMLSAMKNSCIGTGLSGAHGGIKINPKRYSENELRAIVDLYVSEMYYKGYCDSKDVIHPDINTSIREMKWINESFAKYSEQALDVPSVGKPIEYGGIPDYDRAAAMGALAALETFVNSPTIMIGLGMVKTGLRDKKFILQGLGKVGRPLGLMMMEKGAVCVGVKEHEAYLYEPKGIYLEDLLKHRDETGSLEKYGLAKIDNPDSIYTESCDILVLAACHKTLGCYVAKDVRAKIILEASDGPVTPTSHKILTDKNKLVVPDIYAGAGANVASYFEYLRNLHEIGIPQDDILSFSNKVYADIFKTINRVAEKLVVVGSDIQNVPSKSLVPLEQTFVQKAIHSVYSEIGQEILANLERYRLESDARTAAYAVAIRNMFKTIYEQKRLI